MTKRKEVRHKAQLREDLQAELLYAQRDVDRLMTLLRRAIEFEASVRRKLEEIDE